MSSCARDETVHRVAIVTRNVAHSVRDRLRNLAKSRGEVASSKVVLRGHGEEDATGTGKAGMGVTEAYPCAAVPISVQL